YKYGFVLKKDQLYKPVNFKTVIVDKDIPDLAVFAKEHGITYSHLKQFNLWLRDRKLITNGYSYEIQIPDVKELSYATPNKYAHNKNWVVD
ncbi:MAG: lytic transglycosylase domain-containing protein, partial [Tannerellaceae bacterium]